MEWSREGLREACLLKHMVTNLLDICCIPYRAQEDFWIKGCKSLVITIELSSILNVQSLNIDLFLP